MKKVSIIITSLIYSCILLAGNDPDDKRIQKRLNKLWKSDQIELIELRNVPGTDPSGEFYRIEGPEKNYGLLYKGRVYTCGANGCELEKNEKATEYFEFFLITNTTGEVLYTEITTYAATHGYEVCSKGWLKQFQGKTGEEAMVYGKDVDAISGATRSGTNLTREINIILQNVKKNQGRYLTENKD